ncbi:MAG: sugar ABC transporter substrate-binding protein [Eubacteriales bacterium]|jgi:ABC-type sugar transport system substrate-binding protein
MKKRTTALLLSVITAVTLAGCGSSESTTESTSEASVSLSASSTSTESAAVETTSSSSASESVVTSSSSSSGETVEEGEVIKANENYNITLIVKNLTNPMWTALKEGAQDAADAAGVTLTVLAPSTDDNNEQQISEIEQSIAKGEDAIVLVPADGTGIVPGVKEANEAGIPIIDVNTEIDTSSGAEYVTFVGVDNYTAACEVAETLAEMMDYEGDVIILEGKAGASSSVDIVNGANDTFAKYDGINVVASQTADWSRDEAYTVTTNLLQSNPDCKAIFAANDEMAMGALKSVQAAGKTDILISGLDANDDAKEAVDNGELAVTCDKNGYGQGWCGVMAAVKALNGETLADRIDVPTELYTKESSEQ